MFLKKICRKREVLSKRRGEYSGQKFVFNRDLFGVSNFYVASKNIKLTNMLCKWVMIMKLGEIQGW